MAMTFAFTLKVRMCVCVSMCRATTTEQSVLCVNIMSWGLDTVRVDSLDCYIIQQEHIFSTFSLLNKHNCSYTPRYANTCRAMYIYTHVCLFHIIYFHYLNYILRLLLCRPTPTLTITCLTLMLILTLDQIITLIFNDFLEGNIPTVGEKHCIRTHAHIPLTCEETLKAPTAADWKHALYGQPNGEEFFFWLSTDAVYSIFLERKSCCTPKCSWDKREDILFLNLSTWKES